MMVLGAGYVFFISRVLLNPTHDPKNRTHFMVHSVVLYTYIKISSEFYYPRPMTHKTRPISWFIVLYCMLISRVSRVPLHPTHDPKKPDPFHGLLYSFVCLYHKSQEFYNPRPMAQPRPILWFIVLFCMLI